MAHFRIYIDNQNYPAIAASPEDRRDEDIRIRSIRGISNETQFVMWDGRTIVTQLPFAEIFPALQKESESVGFEGTEHTSR